MLTAPTECLRCKGPMEQGLIIDKADLNVPNAPEWIDGPTEKSFLGGLKTRGHTKLRVVTFRCTNCGYLESYALADAV